MPGPVCVQGNAEAIAGICDPGRATPGSVGSEGGGLMGAVLMCKCAKYGKRQREHLVRPSTEP